MVFDKHDSYSQGNNYLARRPTVFDRFRVVPDLFKTDSVSWERACGRSWTNQMKVRLRLRVVKSEKYEIFSPVQNEASLNYPRKRMVIKKLLLDESVWIK